MTLLATVPFPITAEGYVTTDDTGRSGTTLSLNIPVGVEAGELLYAIVTEDAATNSIAFPGTWTEIWSNVDTGDGDVAAAGAWLLADGTETGTISVTLNGTAGACGAMYRISGCADPNLVPPIGSSGIWRADAIVYGTKANPPPAFAPDLKCENMLSICTASAGDVNETFPNVPEEYAQTFEVTGGDTRMVGAHRNVACAPMELPSAWDTATVYDDIICATVIFFPENRWVPPTDMPFVRSMDITDERGRVTSTTFKLRLPGYARVGDIYLAVVAQKDMSTNGDDWVTWPSDWTELFEEYAKESGTTTPNVNVSCAYKKIDGSEGRTVTIPTIAEKVCVGAAYVIGGAADPDVTPPEFQDSTANNGNFDTLTPSWGSAKTLWIAISAYEVNTAPFGTGGWRNDNFTTTTAAGSFPNDWAGTAWLSRTWVHSNNTADTDNCGMYISWAVSEVSSILPTAQNTFDYNAVESATVVAFKPGSFTVDNWWYLAWEGKVRGATQ